MKRCTGIGFALVMVVGRPSIGAAAQDEPELEQPAQGGIAEELAVAVPGLRALDGDDDIAHELTGWLRAGTSAVEGWHLHTAAVSLEQFILVNGCESPNEDCLSRIASALEADRLISGSVRRTETEGPEGHYDFEVRLFLFNAATGRIEKSSRVRIETDKATPEQLAALGQQQVARFAEAPFDQLERKQAIELRLSRDDVPPSQPTSPEADRGDIFPAWPAAVSYTGAVVFFGLTAWNWTTIKNLGQEPSLQRARAIAGPGVNDVCDSGTNFGVEDLDGLCSKANTHETLQWVFLGMGVASVGVGTWLLVKSVKSKRSAERPRLELAPIAGKKLGGVSARLEF